MSRRSERREKRRQQREWRQGQQQRFRPEFHRPEGVEDAPQAPAANNLTQKTSPAMMRLIQGVAPRGIPDFNPVEANSHGYYPLTSAVVRIEPEDASDIVTLHNYAFQRHFDSAHAEQLAQEIEEIINITIAIGPGRYPWIINGQHSLWAVVLKNRPIKATVTIYLCSGEQAIAKAYATFDNGKTRSGKSVIDAARNAGMVSVDVVSARLNQAITVVKSVEVGFTRHRPLTNSEKVRMAQEPRVQGFAAFVEKFCEPKKKRLYPTGILWALYAMWSSDPEKAAEFAEQYFSGQLLCDDDPTFKLREKMQNRSDKEHAASAAVEHMQLAYSAWRAFCMNRRMGQLRHTRSVPAYNHWKVAPETATAALEVA